MAIVPGKSEGRRRRTVFRAQVRAMMRPYIGLSLGFSLISNVLLLVSPIYMMQVYDRVMVSGSLDTLFWLSAIGVFLLAIYGAAEIGRRRVLSLAGARLEADLTRRVFQQYEASGNQSGIDGDLAQVSRVAQLYSGNALSPLFDLPFTPLFVAVLFLVHPLLGWVGVGGAVVVLVVALMAEATTRGPSERAMDVRQQALSLTGAMQRQRPAVVAMGMSGDLRARYDRVRGEADALALQTTGKEGGFAAFTKSFRQILQMSMLGLGAALALSQEISAGTIVAGSIVLARALGPIDQIVGGWRSLTKGREAWRALKRELEALPGTAPTFTPLPRPSPVLVIDRMAVAAPGAERPLIHPFSLKVDGGALISVVGAIGAGKTTLLQTLGGAMAPREGVALLGASDVHAWAHVDRGRYVGFVPQHAEMFPGSVKENVARFMQAPDRDVFEALQAAGATDLALSLPSGLDTRVGPGGVPLSA
ncbi:MAG: ATP-binding cassette domain-containing protein, partial [Sphingomonadales bacterium]